MRHYFSSSKRFGVAGGSGKTVPILVVIIVLLAALLLLQFSGIGGLNASSVSNSLKGQMNKEIKNAVSVADSLSNLGGSDSYQKLEYLRQYIHGIELINEISKNFFGSSGFSIPESYFDDLYTLISEYNTKLISGQKVTEILSNLQSQLEQLRQLISTL